MKRIFLSILAIVTVMICGAVTPIGLSISSDPPHNPSKGDDEPLRMPPVIPTAWYDGGTLYVHTTLPGQTVTVEVACEDGVVAVRQVVTGSDRTGRADASMLLPGETYTLNVVIGERQWSGSFEID